MGLPKLAPPELSLEPMLLLRTSTPLSGLRFRDDIHGLRGYAVLLVLFYHLGLPGFSGGLIGVDIFFVISGFLITQIISQQLAEGRFSLLRFWQTRLLRIYPPMLGLLTILLTFGYFFLEPKEYSGLGKGSLGALAGLGNFFSYRDSDYFAPGPISNWTLHLWSLGVELQFYLLYPLFLLGLKRISWRGAQMALLALLCLSISLSVVLTSTDRSAAFYLLPSRTWEFLFGALAYRWMHTVREGQRRALFLLGVLLLFGGVITASLGYPFPGFVAALPALGTAALILAASSSVLIANPVSSFLGSISYSLYLVHWPVILVARHWGSTFSPKDIVLICGSTLLAACLSRVLLERPFSLRRVQRLSSTRLFSYGLSAAIPFLMGALVVAFHGFPKRVPALISNFSASLMSETDIRQNVCFLSPPAGGEKFGEQCFSPSSPAEGKEVLLFGDSHAVHFWPALAKSPSLQSSRLLQLTAAACPPLFFKSGPPQGSDFDPVTGVVTRCASINKRAFDWIKKQPPAVVVLSARWSFYHSHGVDVIRELDRVLSSLRRSHARAVLIGPIPEWVPALPQRAFQETFLHGGQLPTRLHDQSEANIGELDRKMRRLAERHRIDYVSLRDELCNAEGCTISVTNAANQSALVSWDSAHLTRPGSEWLMEKAIAPKISRLLK